MTIKKLKIEETTESEAFHATYENAMAVIRELHEKFWVEALYSATKNDDSFKMLYRSDLPDLGRS